MLSLHLADAVFHLLVYGALQFCLLQLNLEEAQRHREAVLHVERIQHLSRPLEGQLGS